MFSHCEENINYHECHINLALIFFVCFVHFVFEKTQRLCVFALKILASSYSSRMRFHSSKLCTSNLLHAAAN